MCEMGELIENKALGFSRSVYLLLWLGFLFWMGMKPIHLDEANFLMLTTGEWWAPHLVQVNWEGVTQSAFDVLSNPPGMAWWLWPVKDASVVWMRLWVLPWSILTLWGMWCLAQQYRMHQNVILLVSVSPFFALSHNSLMPEMPLLACVVCGWQGILSGKNIVFWATVLGFAGWFRYSGLAMLPLFVFWVMWNRPKYGLMAVLANIGPTAVLVVHDIWVYGEWHFLHMIGFQQEQQSWGSLVHKCAANMAMLGGGFALPFWERITRKSLFVSLVLASAIVGFVLLVGLPINLWSICWIWVGGFLLHIAIVRSYQQSDWFAMLWIIGGGVFLLSLRFAATRYWGPFVVPVVLMAVGSSVPSRWWLMGWGVVSLHLVWDDAQLARSQHQLADMVNDACPDTVKYFSGHWGWQHNIESLDWVAVDNDTKIPNSVCYSYSERSWPQQVANDCWGEETWFVMPFETVGLPLRVHTVDGASNYHSFMISNEPPFPTYAPWGIGTDYWDRASFRRVCRF